MFFKNIFRNSSIKRTLNWGISDDYEVFNNLGKGSSAKIFQGVHVITGQKVVIKIFKKIKPESIKKQIDINLNLVQYLNLSKAERPYVKFIELLDILHDNNSDTYTMIYKFYHGVPLNQLIQAINYKDTIKSMFYLLHTVKFVHQLGLIHRDIKPANILITKDGPRLFDFGLATLFYQEQEMKVNNFGTKCYKTPQVVYRMPTYNQQVDVWALGLVFAQMLLNKRHILKYQNDLMTLSQIGSFCSLKQQQKQLLIPQSLSKHINISKSKAWQYMANKHNISRQLTQLVKKMLQIDPKKRPSINQILQNIVFKNVQL